MDMQAVQSTEAKKYGLSGTLDGRGSNPQSRPVEGMLFETPTMAAMVNAEDLSGMVKSAPNVAAKIVLWGTKSSLPWACLQKHGTACVLMGQRRRWLR